MTAIQLSRPMDQANCALRRSIMINDAAPQDALMAIAVATPILLIGGLLMVAMSQRGNLGYFWQLLMELCT